LITTGLPEAAAAAHGLLGLGDNTKKLDLVRSLGRFEQARTNLATSLSAADALNFDAAIGAKLRELVDPLSMADSDLAAAADNLAAAAEDGGRPDALLRAYGEYQEALSGVWRAAVGALDVLLERRTGYVRAHLVRQLESAGALLAIVLTLVWLVSRSITSRL